MLSLTTCVRSRYGPARDELPRLFWGGRPGGFVLGASPFPRPLALRPGRYCTPREAQGGGHPSGRPPSRPPSPHGSRAGRGDIGPLSIGLASRHGLRPRLTQGGRTLPWKPRSIGDGDSHPISLLTPAFSLPPGPPALSVRLRPWRDAPLPLRRMSHLPVRGFGGALSPGKFWARRDLTSELLRIL
jgi:hypothetical protein